MIPPTLQIELGERYAAMGLTAAARAVFARALATGRGEEAAAARRLTELALASGDGRAARAHADELARREPGPAARLLVGHAQLACGELAAARRAFATVLEAGGVPRLQRARAHLGRSAVAATEGDDAGAGAHMVAAFEDLLPLAVADTVEGQGDAVFALAEEILGRAVRYGRGADVAEQIDAFAAAQPAARADLLRALLLAARQANGEVGATDAEIEAALERDLARQPGARQTRLRHAARRLRRRYRDEQARATAIAELEELAGELASASRSGADDVELARVYFLLAAAFADDPATLARAESAYRKGLRLRPGHAAAANNLALLSLAAGDVEGALHSLEMALVADPEHGSAWRTAARTLDAGSAAPGLAGAVARVLDAARPGAGSVAGDVAARLLTATAEVTRGNLLAGMHTRGHRLKNLLGIVGSRTRSARKLAGEHPVGERLRELESQLTALYDEWAAYLRSMQAAGPSLEVVSVLPLLSEVVAAASSEGRPPVRLSVPSGLPDLRGDRMLLREALLNLCTNAVDACVATGGQVDVGVRVQSGRGAPIIEIEVADTGSGILRADLARIFAPGFTTKENGSGVGLTIAERVIVAHHGRILIDSEVGRGTRITVLLPADLGGFASLGLAPPTPGVDER